MGPVLGVRRGCGSGQSWKDLTPALKHPRAEAGEVQGQWRTHGPPKVKGTHSAGQGTEELALGLEGAEGEEGREGT